MRKLKLVGLSEDAQQVVFVDEVGAEFSAAADDRLRAALRGDRARLGQLEIDMDSALRPRDIQNRIRGGESPEAVAVLAQVSVDKIMSFCVPVLAERQHIAQLAGQSHVRRKSAEGPARRLSDVVAERLRARGINPDSTDWDAWRREDSRWSVQASYRSGERARVAVFVFDAVGRYSLADDDEARWLTGERQSTSKGPQPREPGRAGERRLSSVPPSADDDLITLAAEPGDDLGDETTDDLTAVVRAVRETEHPPSAGADPAPTHSEAPEHAPDASPHEADHQAAGPSQPVPAADPVVEADPVRETEPTPAPVSEPVTEPTPERRARSSRRASVPSWDEIMFGKSKDD